jgi:mannose/fructose-specific phosphotransferase system component IIA
MKSKTKKNQEKKDTGSLIRKRNCQEVAMKGILLISHGPLAEGMLKTAEIFFGENIPQMKAVVLNTQDDPEDFRGRLQEAVKEVDTGEGVLVFADLLGGTPCNQSAFVLNEQITVLTGMNLPMVMECLGLRMGGEISTDTLEETAKTGIVNFNKMLEEKKKAGRSRRRSKEEPTE